MKGIRVGNLYKLLGSTVVDGAQMVIEHDEFPVRLWHRRLGHMSEKGMEILMKRELIPKMCFGDKEFCEHCVYGKHHKRSFKAGSHTSKGILDYIHSDLWGPSRTKSCGGASYFISFIDDYSRKVWVKFLKSKDEAFMAFKHFKTEVEKETGRCIKVIRTDNGLEFVNKVFLKYCKDEGIVMHNTIVRSPQQNGVAERMNRTLVERTRCMLSNAGVGKELWAEAINTACYLVNRSPSAALGEKRPQEVWHGTPCDYFDLKIFGCDAYALIPSCQRDKLDPKSKKCIFVGYGKHVKGYRLWDPVSRKIILSRDVHFDESRMLDKTLETNKEGVQNEVEHFIPGGLIPESGLEDVTPNGEVVDRNEEEVEENDGQLEQPQLPPSQDRPRRERRLPARLQDCVDPSTMRALITEDGEPTTFQFSNQTDAARKLLQQENGYALLTRKGFHKAQSLVR